MKACQQEDCIPHITGCMHGHQPNAIHKCKFYQQKPIQIEKQEKVPIAQLIPWAGVSLGQRDIADLAASRTLSLFGIIGVQNSGKTTLLTLLYCLLRQGHKIGSYCFAGSLTLPAWETLAYYMTWKPGNYITFPPHTPGSVGRIPGLLHLTLKSDTGNLRDILITDAKGEWFKEWATNEGAVNAQSAGWIHHYSSAFVLVADCERLSGADRGIARDEIKDLFNRLNNRLNNRPVALSWTKSDKPVRLAMRENILAHLLTNGISIPDFSISTYKREEAPKDHWQHQVLALFEFLLVTTERQRNDLPFINTCQSNDRFLSIRGY